jgi:hypothetical protein
VKTIDENEGKLQHEAGKTQKFSREELGYDYEHAISEATRLWNLLKERHATRGWKYPPRDAAFEHLLNAWRANPGKAIVHLFDLPDFIHVTLDTEGIELLKKEWWKLVAEHGFKEASRLYVGIYRTSVGAHQTTSVYELRKLAIETDLSFEENVVGIRPGANGKPFRTKLPLRIDNEPFGELFGFYGDLAADKVGHVTKDKEVEKFVRTVGSALGGIETVTRLVGDYISTYSTTTIQNIFGTGGIDTSVRQLLADNPAPLFLFTTSDIVVSGYLRILFECEGGVSRNDKRNTPSSVNLHQAVICRPPENAIIPRHPGRISFRRVEFSENLLDMPPRLLIAASLLLQRLNINNRLWPADLYTNEYNEKSNALETHDPSALESNESSHSHILRLPLPFFSC